MASRFGLSEEQEQVLAEILNADGADFATLVRVARLDPSEDFRGADLRDVDFGRSDLEGYDFSGADLSGCRFDRAALKGAIFADNRDEGTVWPKPPSERQPSRAVLRATTEFELQPFQLDAMSSIVAALEQGVARPVVLMPPGTGRTMLLEALLAELDMRDMLGVALVYASTQNAVQQLQHRFSHRFGSNAVASWPSKDMFVPFDARLIVAGVSSLRMEAYSATRPFDDVSHIIIFDRPPSSSRLRFLQAQYPGVQIICFADARPMSEMHRHLILDEGRIVFDLSYPQAVNAELLEPSAIRSYRSPGSVEGAEEEEMGRIVSEVFEVVRSMPNGAVGGIVCSNTASVRELARQLQDGADNDRHSNSGIQRVVQHTSPSADESLVQAALDLPGTVLLINDIVASKFDWAVLDYVIVFARLKSPEHLAFPRRRRGRNRQLQVIDFKDNFHWMGASH